MEWGLQLVNMEWAKLRVCGKASKRSKGGSWAFRRAANSNLKPVKAGA